jgi:hypothetical protein
MRAGEQAVDELFVSVGRGVGEERVDLGERRRQAGEIERRAADQLRLVRFGRRLEPFLFETRENERVDRVARPAGRLHRRLAWPDGLHERPVLLVGLHFAVTPSGPIRALVDPRR